MAAGPLRVCVPAPPGVSLNLYCIALYGKVRCRGREHDIAGSHDIVDGLTISHWSCLPNQRTFVRRRLLREPHDAACDAARDAMS